MADKSEAKIEKKEVDAAMQLYKIAGIIIGTLILIGIIVAIFNSIPQRKAAVEPASVIDKTPETSPIANETSSLNETSLQHMTQATSQNATLISNATNVSVNTSVNASVNTSLPHNTSQLNLEVTNTQNKSSGVFHYNWTTIKITYPSDAKRLTLGQREYIYLNITEIDGTPITNGEQFNLLIYTTDAFGKDSQIKATFENNQWLIAPLISNAGKYELYVTITCADKNGYCLRFYGEGSAHATFPFEVV